LSQNKPYLKPQRGLFENESENNMRAIWKGERLKIRRKQLGLTQKQVADRIGASKSNVAIWETGSSTPTGDYLITLCEILRVTPVDFFKIE